MNSNELRERINTLAAEHGLANFRLIDFADEVNVLLQDYEHRLISATYKWSKQKRVGVTDPSYYGPNFEKPHTNEPDPELVLKDIERQGLL